VHDNRNLYADGCDERKGGGLSHLGMLLVEELNKLNIIYDCSHLSEKSSLDGIEIAKFPVCTHSNARSVCDNPRNKSDEVIKAIAEKDGVLGLVTYPTFVKSGLKTEKGERPTIEDALDHVDYIADLVGINHVGIGWDFVTGEDPKTPKIRDSYPWTSDVWGIPGPNGISAQYAEGLSEIGETCNLSKGLLARGYSKKEIEGVLGQNWLRVFKRAWGK